MGNLMGTGQHSPQGHGYTVGICHNLTEALDVGVELGSWWPVESGSG